MAAGPFDVMDYGRMAVLLDPTGATLSVWQAKTHPGILVHNQPGAFCWGQLNTSDTAMAESFYTALFGPRGLARREDVRAADRHPGHRPLRGFRGPPGRDVRDLPRLGPAPARVLG